MKPLKDHSRRELYEYIIELENRNNHLVNKFNDLFRELNAMAYKYKRGAKEK